MTKYVDVTVGFNPQGAGKEAFLAFLELVTEELDKIDLEVTYAANLKHYTAVFHFPPTDDISVAGIMATLANLQTALHAAECGTPGWPAGVEVEVHSASVEDLDADVPELVASAG